MKSFVDKMARILDGDMLSNSETKDNRFGGYSTHALDSAARALAGPLPRRQALRAAACALLAGTLAAVLTGCNTSCGNCSSGQWYCADTKTCCPSGSGVDCSGSCYTSSCPSNLLQTATCSASDTC
jgi:hypothetical protein